MKTKLINKNSELERDTLLKEISERIHFLIKDEVSKLKTDSIYEDQIDELDWRFDDLLQDAKGVMEDFKEQGLNYGSLEAEGYLRGVITAVNLFKEYTK